MALFAYMYAFGQTMNLDDLFDAQAYVHAEDFALRQLRYGAIRDIRAKNSSAYNETSQSMQSPYEFILGNNFEIIFSEFQQYLKSNNFSNVFKYLRSIASTNCYGSEMTHFIGRLIRYGRVCEVSLKECNFRRCLNKSKFL